MVKVAAMKLAYSSGMYTTQVIDVNLVPFVDITVDEEGELNTGKWEQKNVSYGKLWVGCDWPVVIFTECDRLVCNPPESYQFL
jgi:hypothetical protein